MSPLRFDNKVAVITGAGRGLGRAYATLLAARGARVVVNDIGASLGGNPDGGDPAGSVVQEIREAGGEAIACSASVTTAEGAKAIVASALDTFGGADILIHSAGNIRRAPLAEMSHDDFELVLDVHLRGAFNVVRELFPLMLAQSYGRIILTSSINGLYGKSNNVNYSVAKAGLHGLSQTAAIEGQNHNIKSNVIVPAAVTRMSEGIDTSAFPPMEPDMVAPAVAWMAHDTCSISGEMLVAMGGRMARAYVAETPGVFQPAWTCEDVGARIDEIRDIADPVVFPPLPDGQLAHLLYGFDMIKKASA